MREVFGERGFHKNGKVATRAIKPTEYGDGTKQTKRYKSVITARDI
jgi:hypothetical protein